MKTRQWGYIEVQRNHRKDSIFTLLDPIPEEACWLWRWLASGFCFASHHVLETGRGGSVFLHVFHLFSSVFYKVYIQLD